MLIVQRYSFLSKTVEIRRVRWIMIRDQRLSFIKTITHFRYLLSSTHQRVEIEVIQIRSCKF